jgi:ABC-type polysaccharide/polyol phosphate export permease
VAPAPGAWVTAQAPKAVEIVRRIVGFPALCFAHRDLIRTSVRRELQARFTGTTLGWLWPLLHPLLLFGIYYFIFTKLLSFKFPDLPESQKFAFGIYMFVGVLAWTAVAESLNRGAGVILENGNLIKKLAFPSEVLPLNVVLVSLVTMVLGIVTYCAMVTVTSVWTAPGPMLVWVPVLVAVQGVFLLGLALFLSALQVFLRDTLQVVGVVSTVWMFVTPIFWAEELVKPDIDPYLWVVHANPMYHLVYAWRVVLMSSEPERFFTDDFGASLAIFSAWALGAFVCGYAFFILCQRRFADEV